MLMLAEAGFHAYALVASEFVAPWTWAAVPVALGGAALLFVAVRTPQVLWLVAMLGAVIAAAALAGAHNGRYLGLYGPWLWLFLSSLLACTRHRTLAVSALASIFGVAWIGIITELWQATFRYSEPWPEIVAMVVDQTRPGDLIVSSHPSFYFYARYQLGWEGWSETFPAETVERSGRYFAPVAAIDEPPPHDRVVFVHTVSMRPDQQRQLEHLLDDERRLVETKRFVEGSASALKNRFLGNQRRWRIEVKTYERVGGAEIQQE